MNDKDKKYDSVSKLLSAYPTVKPRTPGEIKLVEVYTKEYNELSSKFNALMVVHTKTVNDFADKCLAFDEMKKSVKDLTKIIVRWEKENEILQESLDNSEREIERLNEKEKRSDMLELMEEEGDMG